MESERANSLRIVEIGDKPYIKHAFPRQTSYFSTYFVTEDVDPAAGRYVFGPGSLAPLWRLINQADLIVCHPTYFSPWHWRWLSRAMFDRRILRGHFPIFRAFGPQMLRLSMPAPIAIIDAEDLPVINRNNFFLLDRCKLYFKRELPNDYWRLFIKTGHANLPTPRFRSLDRYRRRLEKIRPIALGLPMSQSQILPSGPTTKTVDVFFSGRVQGSSTVRVKGFAELMALRDEGVTIDIPDQVLPRKEFYERCARAWLTWSPEGLGWDCFRHYEAPACGSVPVINRQNIERYKPLRHGEHAIYYDTEDNGLTQAIHWGLADKDRLQAIAAAGRAHVSAHHTPEALATHIVGTTLGIDIPA